VLLINKEAAIERSVVTTGQHEFFHKFLKNLSKKNPEIIKNSATILGKQINSMEGAGNLKRRIKAAEEDYTANKITLDTYYEEVLTYFGEALQNKEIKQNKSFINKINDYFRQVLQNNGFKKLTLIKETTGREL